MSKKSVMVPLTSLAPDMGHDELNVGQLSLISAQSRVPGNYTSWSRTYQAGERTVKVTCTALTGEVVPHGLDNDVMVAIINLYVEQGCSANGIVRTTLYRLLSVAGLPVSAHYYREVRQSLRRLQSTNYQIEQGWWSRGKERYVDASFNYLWKVVVVQEERDNAASVLEIRLPDEVAQSIREGYVKPLDLDVYHRLNSPPVRAIYRTLDALRWELGTPKEMVSVGLLDWGEWLSIYSTEPDKIRRVLQPAHEELCQNGILSRVEMEGRGKAQILNYHFTQPNVGPDPELLRELTSRGMYPAVAGKYLTEHPDPAAVMRALKKFDAYPGHRQNPGALLRDMLLYPEQYGNGLEEEPAPIAKTALLRVSAEQVEEKAAQALTDELYALTDERLLKRLESHLSFSGLRPFFSAQDLHDLKTRAAAGELPLIDMIQYISQRLTAPPEDTAAEFKVKFLGS